MQINGLRNRLKVVKMVVRQRIRFKLLLTLKIWNKEEESMYGDGRNSVC